MTTAFFTSAQLDSHTLQGHPEFAGRRQAVVSLLEQREVLSQLHVLQASPATDAQLTTVHKSHYLEVLSDSIPTNGIGYFDADTYLTSQSLELARLAVGGTIAVVESVLAGHHQTGMAVVRPPGHHATPRQAMGFCLFNNIAIAARYAQQTHGLERVAIVDFDVHHGNGTQDAFYDDPSVLFISSHQSPLYPGTGRLEERGRGDGMGYTINLPVPAYTGDMAFQSMYEEVVIPALKRFAPQLILVSAGFDAHFVDPLAQLNVTLGGFNHLCRLLLQASIDLCEGKIAFVMEGGYDLKALSHGWLNIAHLLLGQPALPDPYGAPRHVAAVDEELIKAFKKTHLS